MPFSRHPAKRSARVGAQVGISWYGTQHKGLMHLSLCGTHERALDLVMFTFGVETPGSLGGHVWRMNAKPQQCEVEHRGDSPAGQRALSLLGR